jgi:uncharacterized protein with PIN domain
MFDSNENRCPNCETAGTMELVDKEESPGWTSEDPWGVINVYEHWKCAKCGAIHIRFVDQRPWW